MQKYNIDFKEINIFKKKGYLHIKNFFSEIYLNKILNEIKKNRFAIIY